MSFQVLQGVWTGIPEHVCTRQYTAVLVHATPGNENIGTVKIIDNNLIFTILDYKLCLPYLNPSRAPIDCSIRKIYVRINTTFKR